MDPLLATALEAAEAAALVHRRYFGRVNAAAAEDKSHSDFVTRVDLEAQEAALTVIRSRFPGHAILAEEDPPPDREQPSEIPGDGGSTETGETEARGEAGTGSTGSDRVWPVDGTYLWIVDPLDGTTNYLHRHPYFSASVGVGRRIPRKRAAGRKRGSLGQRGEPLGPRPEPLEGQQGSLSGADRVRGPSVSLESGVVLEAGAVVAARTGERWWARRGKGAFKNGIPISVSRPGPLARALVGTGFPFKKPELVEGYLEEFQRVLPSSSGIRRTGSAAMDLCYLAEGILDAFWEDYLSPWDIAAGLAILEEAGGQARRVDGSDIDLVNGSVLAANGPETLRALESLVVGS